MESTFRYVFHPSLPKINLVIAVHVHLLNDSIARGFIGVKFAGIDLRSKVRGHPLMSSEVSVSLRLAAFSIYIDVLLDVKVFFV